MYGLEQHFLLDPSITFLNHGSFGAAPKDVFEAYQIWQLRLERQPVLFLGRELDNLLRDSRKALGDYLNADVDDLVHIPNATHGINIVAHSLKLKQGDEVLSTDHEYGACNYAWDFICGKVGAKYIHQPIALPVHSEEEIIDQFWKGVTEKTRVIYLSHITSPTALQMPVVQICKRAKQAGILTIIDAAHAPGQIPVDLRVMDADIVFGNCHKWMLNVKGSAFLYVRRKLQDMIEPLIVSWGYNSNVETTTGSRFVDILQWTGTKDPAAVLTVPVAIQFMQEHNWADIRGECHLLLRRAVEQICDLTNMSPLYPLDSGLYSQMGIAPLPLSNLAVLKNRLYDEYKIEVPLIQWQDKQFVRISVQGYNSRKDIEALVRGLEILLPQVVI
ncbi:MAG: aminotransferase class V-fold PLP-dependent enzyme [Anaerolineales bacterium]|nr:aminotransferase class V-fold PLP-dependent enzyme [Anaerolineales bacterium]